MYRLALLCCVAMILFVPSAQALEMFTNFHNGENVGFPPLEVPTKFYGHGGWHATAQCRPERVESIESVPAMTPTGRAAVTPTGFIRRDRGRRGYETQRPGNPQGDNQQISNPQTSNQPVESSGQYVSDRRRSWGGTNDSGNAGSNQPLAEYQTADTSAAEAPTPAKVAPKSDGWTRSLEQAPADDPPAKRPTSVFAHPGAAPQIESADKTKSKSGQDQNIDRRSPTPPGASSRQTKDKLPSVMTAPALD